MTFTEHRESLDPEHAIFFVSRIRDLLDKTRDVEFEVAANIFAIMGYPRPRDPEDLARMRELLRRTSYPGRSGGIY